MHERTRFESEVGLLVRDAIPAYADRETARADEKCKQDWTRLLAALPEDVRAALERGDSSNAITLAIHHGTRDLTALTRMAFHARYGKERGYCRLGNTKADAKYLQLWDQEKKGIRAIMARPSPPLAQKGGVVCRKVERVLADAKPDNPKVDLTGRYENRYKSGNATRTDWILCLNQAGRHIEGIVTKVIYPDPRPRGWWSHQDDDPKNRPYAEIHGDLQSDGSFLFFDKKDPSGNWGYFRFENGGLTWELAGKSKSRPVLVAKRPTQINTAPFDKLVWLHEKFPLTQAQIRHLVGGLAEYKLAPYLQAYFTTPAGIRDAEKRALSDKAGKVQVYIAEVFTNAFSGIHDRDLDLGQFYAKAILASNKWKFKQITRSLLDWIQIMLDVNAGNGFKLSAIQKYLGLRPSKNNPDADSAQHEYKIGLKLTGGAFIIGGYKGKITIKKTNGKKWGPETFDVHFLGGGLDASPRDSVEGTAKTYHEWLPPDFPGTIRLGEIGISMGSSAAAGFMQIFGSGYLPPMDVGYTDGDLKFKKPKPPKAGGKALPFGRIWNKKFTDYDATKAVVKTDYAADYQFQDDVHFCLGSALLTEDARQALRIVCANELMTFSTPANRLEVVGHTDRVDTPDRNLTLSLLRAENAVQAIKDILGGNFTIPEGTIQSSGKGENLAIKDGRPDNVPDPRYRRVDVFLNSRLVVSLRAL